MPIPPLDLSDRPRRGDWIQTFTGKQFWPLDPRPEEIDIEDIAHSLSLLCRYNGHCKQFYSVAQHSVIISRLVPGHAKLQALLHDAPEAYLGDMGGPIKRFFPDFVAAEEILWRAICIRFRIFPTLNDVVKEADGRILSDERKVLLRTPPAPWRDFGPPLDIQIIPWTPIEAKEMFLDTFNHLIKDRQCSTTC